MVHKQELLVLAAVLVVVGAVIWLVPWPVEAEPATNVIGQVLFWIGVALIILWACLVAYWSAKT